MSQKTKQGLRQTNNSNFPNNNSAFITPEKLRDFNSDIIDSVALDVDSQLSGSVDITGSLLVSTNITASGHISASTYYGDGSNLTGVTAQPPAGTISGSSQVILTDTTGNLGGNRITGSVSSAVSSSYAVSASRVNVDNQPNYNKEHYLTWVDNTDYDGIKIDATNLKYNSSTNILDSVYFRGDLIGNADTATSSQTSISSSFSQTSISASHAEVADFAISASFTNAQTVNVNTKGDNRQYSLLFATSSGEQPIYIDQQKNILYNPSGNRLTVSHFQGQLTGNVDTATTASYAHNATSASYAISSSHAEVADLALQANNATYAQNTITTGKNLHSLEITKGTPLYFTGSGTSGNLVGIYPADAGNPARMPAGGIAGEDIAVGAEGVVLLDGFINGVDTTLFQAGDEVFVAVGGGYTNIAPTGSANLIQHLGNVEKSAVNGSGVIQMMGEARGLPNLQSGYAWVGDVNDVPQAVATSSFAVSIDTGSLATTGSNNFIGNQIITGSLTVNDSSATAFTVTSGPGDVSPVIIEGGPNFVDKFTPSKLSGLGALDLGQTGYVTASHFRNDNVYLGEQGSNLNINTVEGGGVYIGANPSSGNPVTLANNLIVDSTQLLTHVNQVRMAGSGSTLNSNPTAVEIIGNVTSSINKSNLIVNPQTITDTLTVGPDNNAFVVGPVTVSGTITLEGDSELSIYSAPTNDAFITGAAAVGNDFVFTRNDGTQFNVGVPGADVSYLATTGSNTFNGNQTLSYTTLDKRGLIFPTQDTSANPAEFFFGRRADGRLALSGSGNWGSNDGIITVSPDNGWIEVQTTFNLNQNTNLRGFTEIRDFNQQATYTASLERAELNTVMKLSQQDPLPGGSVGELAVSGSNLYFHNGTSWSQIN